MMNTPEYICTLYFDGQIPCFGGILALDGKTGDTLWTHWTSHAIISVGCSLDLTNDGIKDCIICGRGGILHAVNGYNGASIWELPVQDSLISEEWKFSDIYDAKFMADIDGDNIGDVIASHTMQSREIHKSEILIISGFNGNIIHSSVLPNTEQLFLAPQRLVHPDGESIFVLVTSSQKQSGGLYVIPQVNLMYGDLILRKLHHDTGKGTLLPPILVDITLDGIEDIVAAMFNSTVIVYNGLTFEPIWNFTVPNSEIISIPIPGYYNDDNVPDFMVKHQIGSGFPTYYYTVATIIDGKTGKSLLEKPIEDSLSREMAGLSVTVEGFGNDWFLHWSSDCLNYEGIKEKYQFLKSEDLIAESRVDLCRLRFNSTLITNLYAMSQHVGPPGVSLYFSEYWKLLEYNNSANYKNENENNPFTSERSTQNFKDQTKKQEQEDSYENYDQYAERTKLTSIDSQNDNFNDDYISKNENKWAKKSILTNKDYDMLYDRDGKINLQEEQPIDYQQENKLREQRSLIKSESKVLNNFKVKFKEGKRKREIKLKDNQIYPIHGVQKQPPTGILLSSIVKSKEIASVDLVFSTFWLPSSEAPIILIQEDLDCIHRKKVLSEKNLQYKQNDDIIKQCLDERGVNYKADKETADRENLKISLGQMTIYRMRLQCACPEDMLPNQSCKNISLHQSWSEYLGSHGNGYFKPFHKTSF